MTVRQLWAQAEDYNASDDRLLWPALLPSARAVTGSDLSAAVGVRALGDLSLAMTDGHTGAVSPGVAFIGWAGSVYAFVVTASEPVAFGPADPANARIDLVVGQVYDSEVGGPDNEPEIRVIPGQSSQTPVAPAVPAGAIALWELRYNAGATAPILTDRRSYVVDPRVERLPRGFVATIHAPNQTGACQGTYVQMWAGLQNVPLEAGRLYLCAWHLQLSQVTQAATSSVVDLRTWGANFGGAEWRRGVMGGAVSLATQGAGVHFRGGADVMEPTVTGPISVSLHGSVTPGELRSAFCSLTITDIGKR